MSDPFAPYVSLELHGEGAHGSTSYPDMSPSANTLTGSAGVSVTTAIKKHGSGSIRNTDYTAGSIAVAASSSLVIGSGDFTIEMWLNVTSFVSTATEGVFGNAPASGSSENYLAFKLSQSQAIVSLGGSHALFASHSVPVGTWAHWAITRSAGTLRVFVDGVQTASGAASGVVSSLDPYHIFATRPGTGSESHLRACLDDLRVTIGVARYTSAFTPPGTFVPPATATVAVAAPMPVIAANGGGHASVVNGMASLQSWGGAIANLTTSAPTLFATARSSAGDNDFTYTAPKPILSAFGGATAKLKPPSPTLSITATVVNLGRAALRAPAATLGATGTVSGTASANLTFGFSNGGSYDLVGYGGGIGASLVAPHAAVSGAVTSGSVGRFVGTAPVAGLAAFSGAAASIEAPKGVLQASAVKHALAKAALSAPAADLSAFSGAAATVSAPAAMLSGSVMSGGLAGATLAAPSAALVGYSGAVISITTAGSPTLQATGTTGSSGRATITAPLFELTASGTAQNYGSASLLAPAARLGATAQAWLMAPRATLTAIGTAVVTATYEAYAVNLNHTPKRGVEPVDETTRYTNFPFTHVVRYQGSYFGANATGLYLLEGTTDAGTDIGYAVKTATSDLDSPNQKTVASAYFSGRLGPDAAVTLYAGEGEGVPYAYTTPRGALAQNHRQVFGKGIRQHRYYALGLSGSDVMELDKIELDVKQMNRRI